MTVISWDQIGDRRYEAGLDRGVLYSPDGSGVPWNGLVSVTERTTRSARPVYYDGVKFGDIVVPGDFSYSLKAITYPDEFLAFEGIVENQSGVYLTDQPQSRFHLAYRTRVGTDTTNLDFAYKLHILYNLTAFPTEKNYQTLGLDSDVMEFEWDLSAVPETIDGYRPTAHLILDSAKIDPYLLKDLEDVLYGTDTTSAMLPSLQSLVSYIQKWDRLVIVDNGDGTWTASTSAPGILTMLDATTFQIVSDTAVFTSATQYTLTSTDKNEEDLWPV